jgi:hypothetical protein
MFPDVKSGRTQGTYGNRIGTGYRDFAPKAPSGLTAPLLSRLCNKKNE